MKDISRRKFLKYLGLGAIGLMIKPKFIVANKNDDFRSGDVVQCFDENATSGSTINESVVQIMMDESMKTMTDINDVGEACKSLFPGITENSIISIKVNAAWASIPTHPTFINCLVNSLTQMEFEGNFYKRNNIIIWDRYDNEMVSAGYTIYTGDDPDTVRCFSSGHPGVGYDYACPLEVDIPGSTYTKYPSNIMSILSDYLINVAVLKNHGTAQVTLCLKNHYGSINQYVGNELHNGWCSPSIPSLNQQIRDVITPNNIQKIFIIDSLFGSLVQGPLGNPDWNPQKLIMSLDPIACDYQGWVLINEERVASGYSAIPWPIHHIEAGAQSPYSLGTTDVNLIEINNPSHIEETKIITPKNGVLNISPNPFHRETTISFSLDHRAVAYLDLIDNTGRRIETIHSGTFSSGTHRVRYTTNHNLSSGTYFIRLYSRGKKEIRKIMIIQ
jgi:hypothetical protein